MAGSLHASLGCRQDEMMPVDIESAFQCAVFPFLQIAYHAKPCTMARGLEHLFIVCRLYRFQKKDFDEGTRLFHKMQTRLNNFCVVENH